MDRLIFRSNRGDFAVVRLLLDPDARRCVAVGRFPPLRVGERLYVRGEWLDDPRHGPQLKLQECLLIVPETLSSLQKLLESGVVEGIGPVLAERLVSTLGQDLIPLLEADADDSFPAHPSGNRSLTPLASIPGMGRARAGRLQQFWQALQRERSGRLFLAGLEVPAGLADRIQRTYGERTEAVLRENPYLLAEDIRGVGFSRADELATRLGVTSDSPARARAAILFLLNRAVEEGHVFLPQQKLLEQGEALGISPANLLRGLSSLDEEQKLNVAPEADDEGRLTGDRAVYLVWLWEAETRVANRLAELCGLAETATPGGWTDDRAVGALSAVDDSVLTGIEAGLGLTLAPAQQEALRAGLSAPVVIISGGPGTGKTTLVRGLLQLYARAGLSVVLAAPTGRAARRLQEASGQEASTLHRLLEVQMPGMRFLRDARNPLQAQVVLVDESSMIDLPLFAALLDALPVGARLVLVGDAQQLPPVGPGNVLESLIRVADTLAPRLRCVMLEQVHRQGHQSLIALNARRIQRGLLPQLARGIEAPQADFFFLEANDPESVLARVVELMVRRLPQRYGFDPRRDIQVLSPSQKGPLGVQALNPVLQAALNPPSPSVREGGQRLRTGDKVLQARNNYDRELFNGDLGFVLEPPAVSSAVTPAVTSAVTPAVTPAGTSAEMSGDVRSEVPNTAEEGFEGATLPADGLWVQFDGRQVQLNGAEASDLELAYAMTVHKSQGSEFPAVVLPLLESHASMLRRNLFYTAVTRARKLLVIVGSWEAVGRAVRNDFRDQRYSALANRLRALASPSPI